MVLIFDIEADGLLDNATKIFCLSYQLLDEEQCIKKGTITDYEEMKKFISEQKTLAGHNIIRYDIPLLKKLLNIPITANLIDTLGISWYLYPDRLKHGLESWGEEFNTPKVEIRDWQNLDIKEYIKRCERDVEINAQLFLNQMSYLNQLYGSVGKLRIVNYIGFKLTCLLDQESEGIYLDYSKALSAKSTLEKIIDNKINILSKLMPMKLGKVIRKKPSLRLTEWNKYLAENNLPPDITEIREAPNPTSHQQLKQWLQMLGWKPITFKYSKSTGKKVPQISLPFGQGLCPSVQELFTVEPALQELEGLTIAQHRLGIINAFLETVDDRGRIYSTAHGFTNTMRLQHSKPVVNLPSVSKPYGNDIRGCLTVPNSDYIMCGADISGLEDNTKQHYIYFFDPEYVNQMRVPGFDPHIDIALLGKMISQEDADFYKSFEHDKETNPDFKPTDEEKARYKKIKAVRQDAKVVNFSATYGAGPPKIAESLKKPLEQAKLLHSIYWKRNNAVKRTANSCRVKEVNGQKWLYNPLSRFWMFLKADKDKFSTLNQSSGVFVFDSWLRNVQKRIHPIKVIMQYHDELLLVCKKEEKDFVEKQLHLAMEDTNSEIKLNVDIHISTSWGNNYAECH